MPDLSTIGGRLQHYAKTNYGTVSALCRKLGKNASAFNRYISGETVPGTKIQFELRALGCDIEWLMTGRENSQLTQQAPSQGPELTQNPVQDVAYAPTQVGTHPPVDAYQEGRPPNNRDEEIEQLRDDYQMTKAALKLALRDNSEKARIIEELQMRLATRRANSETNPG